MARSDIASGPCSTSSLRAVAVISSVVAARSRSRLVGAVAATGLAGVAGDGDGACVTRTS
jgi:hypothetical protein